MIRLVFLVACGIYLWFQSLFVQTSHTVVLGRHVFAYNWLGVLLAVGFNVIPSGAALYLWRVKKDKVGAGIFLLAIPLFAAFVLPQLFMERVEVTPTHLIHRREPPHTRFNADIRFDNIDSAVEIQRDNGTTGYVFTLKDGRLVELPANTVLTTARNTISSQLRQRNIPLSVRAVSAEDR
jgi:hypothetical protein